MKSIQPIQQINKSVWQVLYKGELYMMKHYPNPHILQKVASLQERLTELHFQHSLQVEDVLFHQYLLQRWVSNSEPIQYGCEKDRTDALHVLHRLHHVAKQIELSTLPSLPTYHVIQKWKRRLFRFQQMKTVCTTYLSEEEFAAIEKYAIEALTYIEQIDLSQEKQTVLHGDVVHHNFLRDEKGDVLLIDFDLSTKGTESIELILWIHRVLPHVSYDITGLLEEQPSLSLLKRKHLMFLLYPNELLREWLYFSSLSEAQQQENYTKIQSFTRSALSNWPNLWYTIQQINN